LGSYYSPGSYTIKSKTDLGCELVQGVVNFTENSGTNKIVANVTFGTPATNFPPNHTKVALYKKTLDIGNNSVIVFVAEQMLGADGQAVFNNLEPGDYYMGSFIQYPDNYNVAEHIYYQNSVVHSDAISIPVVDGTVFIASLHHVVLANSSGNNQASGTVGVGNSKSLTPKKDMVVVVRDMQLGDIIGVCVTDENGKYAFDNIPENKNIQIFVTSFMHQNWTPYAVLTGENQEYNVDFIIDGNSVYPDGSTGIEDVTLNNLHFAIEPNPAADVVRIHSNVEKAILTVYDLNGRLVKTEFVSQSTELNISDLKSGTYLFILKDQNGAIGVNKLVKR